MLGITEHSSQVESNQIYTGFSHFHDENFRKERKMEMPVLM